MFNALIVTETTSQPRIRAQRVSALSRDIFVTQYLIHFFCVLNWLFETIFIARLLFFSPSLRLILFVLCFRPPLCVCGFGAQKDKDGLLSQFYLLMFPLYPARVLLLP